MKQIITNKQFLELSKEGKDKYFDWCTKKGLYKKTDQEISSSGAVIKGNIPLWNIGQMIEFLDEDSKFLCLLNSKDHWEVGYSVDHPDWDGIELCDALWEATKEVLNK